MNLKHIKNGILSLSGLLVAVLFLIAIFTGNTLSEDKVDVLKTRSATRQAR